MLIHKKIQFSPTNVIADHQGRFVIVSGSLNNVSVVLVNLYAPNWDDKAFIGKVISVLPDLISHHLILGGDLNCAIDHLLDKSCPRQDPPSKMAKAISSFMDQIGGVDPWRFLYPDKKIFSFYSQVHKTFSRTDYCYIDNYFLPAVDSIEYSTIVVSDHAPLLLHLHLHSYKKHAPRGD